MKILVFTSQIHLLGGAEKLAVELAEGLNQTPGVQADVLIMGSQGVPGTARTKKRLIENGVSVVRFLERNPSTGWRGMLKYILKLRRILKEGEYDFVETSMPGPTILALWATMGLRTKLVAGIHVIYQRKHQNSATDRFLRLSVRLNPRVQYYAISKDALQKWVEYVGIGPRRVRLIYNSIEAKFFGVNSEMPCLPLGESPGPQAHKVLFVGRLCALKGLDVLVDSIGPILEENDIHLFISGLANADPDPFYENDFDLLGRTKKLILAKGWSDRIHFLGFRHDLPQVMKSVDLLVHPARKEGFGLVLAEALASGLPVVATNVGGIPEVLANTDSILVLPGDPIGLRSGVLTVLQRSVEEARLCSKRARRRAESFRPQRRVRDMIALFDDLMAASKDR
jgi:glycosyltransferase involved in cell wall biosynthesis